MIRDLPLLITGALAFALALASPGGKISAQVQEDASSYRSAAASVDADLAAELKKLAALREEIAAEKPAVSRQLRELAAELREKQRLAELARQDREALLHDLDSRDQRVSHWREEIGYIEGLLADFARQHDAQAGVAEFQELIDADADAKSPIERASAAFAELDKGQKQGGRILDGQALDGTGVAHRGRFVQVGPLTWFVADDSQLSGLVAEGRDLRPEVVPETGDPEEISALIAGAESAPVFDPTLGAVLALNEVEGGLIEHIRQGGLWIWPILLLAVVALLAAVFKWLQIARIRDLSPTTVSRILDALLEGDADKAKLVLNEIQHPAKEILRRGIELADQPRDLVEEALYEEYVGIQPALQRGLPLIAIASAIAPLLGLLGTVTGIISTFQRILVFDTTDTNVIAGGISEALVTTEFGLAVAIPALIVHALLSRRVQGIRSALEMTSLAFVNRLAAPAAKEFRNDRRKEAQP